MTKKLCNMTYTDDKTGAQRLCQDGTPRPAAYTRLGARVCEDCWPAVKAKLIEEYGRGHEFVAERAVKIAFHKVRA